MAADVKALQQMSMLTVSRYEHFDAVQLDAVDIPLGWLRQKMGRQLLLVLILVDPRQHDLAIVEATEGLCGFVAYDNLVVVAIMVTIASIQKRPWLRFRLSWASVQ